MHYFNNTNYRTKTKVIILKGFLEIGGYLLSSMTLIQSISLLSAIILHIIPYDRYRNMQFKVYVQLLNYWSTHKIPFIQNPSICLVKLWHIILAPFFKVVQLISIHCITFTIVDYCVYVGKLDFGILHVKALQYSMLWFFIWFITPFLFI